MFTQRKGSKSLTRLLLGMFVITGFLYVFHSTWTQNAKPAFRILEPNPNYEMVANYYPNIIPIAPNVVPDIVHYMQFMHSDMDFFFYLSVKSVVKYHKPALIMIHCDCDNLTGKITLIQKVV